MNKLDEKISAPPPENPEQPHDKKQRVAEHVVQSVQTQRKANLLRNIFIPLFTAVLFIFTVVLGHDLFVKNEHISNMHLLEEQITAFQKENNKLPSVSQLKEFKFRSRNMRSPAGGYNPEMILEDSPPDTILIHTPKANLRLLGDGYAVCYLDKTVKWVTPRELERQLRERERFYNTNTILKQIQ